jgi:hypothetical protein
MTSATPVAARHLIAASPVRHRDTAADRASPSAGAYYCSIGVRRTRRSSWAFAATTIVETLIRTAQIAGLNVMPAHASTPAARGIAITL